MHGRAIPPFYVVFRRPPPPCLTLRLIRSAILNRAGALPKWKAQSEAFRAQLRSAAEYNQAVASGRPPPPPPAAVEDPSYVKCPHCGRTFNETAGARHITHCANTQAKPNRLKAGAGHGSYSTVAASQTVQRGGMLGGARTSGTVAGTSRRR